MDRVLILGAGLVVGPGVKYLAEAGFKVTVASRTKSKADALVKGFPTCTALGLDAADPAQLPELEKLIAACDIVISLLPWTMHTPIAELAVKHKVHFGSTSYISDAMDALGDAFKANGKVSFNEVGVDPGLDHASAMKIIDEVHAKGGKVKSFLSYCGGLPCPDDNDNPFGYKFSWSPKGVLLAAVRKAFYIQDGVDKSLDASPGNSIYENYLLDSSVPAECSPPLKVPWPAAFESHPNGDSIKFRKIYGIPECDELIRGTYRTVGWCGTMMKIKDLGLLDDTECPEKLAGKTFAEIMSAELGCEPAGVKAAAAAKLGLALDDAIMGRLEWLGLFGEKKADGATTFIDATCTLFQNNPKFWYAAGERDMICMHHTFKVENADGSMEKITSTCIDFGIANGDTSMARTVTLPLGIAIKNILNGTFKHTGVVRPITPELYTPILAEMETLGIKFTETTTKL